MSEYQGSIGVIPVVLCICVTKIRSRRSLGSAKPRWDWNGLWLIWILMSNSIFHSLNSMFIRKKEGQNMPGSPRPGCCSPTVSWSNQQSRGPNVHEVLAKSVLTGRILYELGLFAWVKCQSWERLWEPAQGPAHFLTQLPTYDSIKP